MVKDAGEIHKRGLTICFCVARHIPRRPSEEIQSFVNDSAYRLVRAQEENMVLKPWVLLASLLLRNHHQDQPAGQKQGMVLEELTAQAVWLRNMFREYGAFLHWPGMNIVLGV